MKVAASQEENIIFKDFGLLILLSSFILLEFERISILLAYCLSQNQLKGGFEFLQIDQELFDLALLLHVIFRANGQSLRFDHLDQCMVFRLDLL